MITDPRIKNPERYYIKRYLQKPFTPRIPELRALEGWYPLQDRAERIKLSCKWNDILRASHSKHFTSCFRPEGMEYLQPIKRLYAPEWAVIYLPDKAGNVLARCYVQYFKESVRYGYKTTARLRASSIYGNNLEIAEVGQALHNVIRLEAGYDIYL